MKLKDCENCLVYGSDNKPFTKAKVALDKGRGTITLYFKNPNMQSMRLRTIVDFYDTQLGLVRTTSELAIKKNPQAGALEPWIANCAIREVKEVFQRQKDLRVEVDIPKEFQLDKGKRFIGTIKNLSAGGIFVVTTQPVKRGTIISFGHRFEDTYCKIQAKVLRAKGAAGKGYAYGCQFVNLPLDMEAAIRKFVYTKQLEKDGRLEEAEA